MNCNLRRPATDLVSIQASLCMLGTPVSVFYVVVVVVVVVVDVVVVLVSLSLSCAISWIGPTS